ncbi:hypothetical protein B0J13DRAFT_594737 [Dactylonectria estremocensis]|uniref:Uncharacterized protein n=1 Tax=Dactylonectria estremocensis TaxID=1079267 RepID=A0A9P9JBW7_9HYPO|nr:hypothetical protein B0J13DRAFT_594737 [Dactylonectria estremocensis]
MSEGGMSEGGISEGGMSGSSSSDALERTSNIGTWVGAVVAIIALLGVVAPSLAIYVSLSDRNRAMNAVQDRPQKYVTRGFRLTRGLHVFRRIHVPNLSEGYITNELDNSPLVPQSALLGRWVLRPRDYLPWNTGWAKLSEVIGAYRVRDGSSNAPVGLRVTTGGTLEVVNSRTALVVNKHWILLLGLLGRYGKREDKGVLQKTGIRRDFNGERASLQHFRVKEEAAEFEWVRKKADRKRKKTVRAWSPFSNSRSSVTSSDDSDLDGSDNEALSLRRSAYGEWMLDKKAQPKIHGITGTMQGLGRHKGSWSYLTSISFVPHTAREIFAPGTLERSDGSSMQTLFWLAHGFLPYGRTSEGRPTVISLERPPGEVDKVGRFFRDDDAADNLTAFSLQESLDIPISIGNAMKCLGIPVPKMLQFLPLDFAPPPLRQCDEDKRDEKEMSDKDDHLWEEDIQERLPKHATLRIQGSWVYCSRLAEDFSGAFPRKDLEQTLAALLCLNWDDWGFLIWKDKFWISILKKAIDMLTHEALRTSAFAASVGVKPNPKALRWMPRSKFHPQKLADYVAFDKSLSTSIQGSEVLPLRLGMGTLFIMDASFRQMVEKVCKRLGKDKTEDQNDDRPASEKISELREDLDKSEQQYWERKNSQSESEAGDPDTDNESDRDGGDPRPTWTRMSLRHLNIATLELFRIDHQLDPEPGMVLIERWVPKWEQDALWAHTFKARAIATIEREEREKLIGVLEYDYTSQRLKWYLDEQTKTSSRSWHLGDTLVKAPLGEKTISISEKEIALVGLWAANRAALWLSSQDSKPLLEFVEELDPYVYVL